MKTLTIRSIPEHVYGAIVRLARRNRRSIQQQTLLLLEQGASLDRECPALEAAAIREQLAGRQLGDTVAELRDERQR